MCFRQLQLGGKGSYSDDSGQNPSCHEGGKQSVQLDLSYPVCMLASLKSMEEIVPLFVLLENLSGGGSISLLRLKSESLMASGY